ncbi:Hypothetical predicted protein [Paramuricea clavata]|uniref:Uncharacterized protein n=1 Tax=Paramuricea clavata TaxID=317549 RepID=A0A6S7K4G7_PARCT|nr:Hypothetical predicted protein [Paramuricea clavata]
MVEPLVFSDKLSGTAPPQPDHFDQDEGKLSESKSDDSDIDIVLDAKAALSSPESSEDEGKMEWRSCDASDDEDVEAIFTTTRSGRVATNWRANNFVCFTIV